MENKKVNCEIDVALKMISGKYKALILELLIEHGILRFNQLQKAIPSANRKTLTTQLRELENDDLIIRKVYPEVPPRVEYSISKKGRSLANILDSLCEWGVANNNNDFELLHPQCNNKKDIQ